MKTTILFWLLAFSSMTLAATPETKVARCDLSDNKNVVGSIAIYQSDNGDEGFLRFAYSIASSKGTLIAGEFTDNVQDAGAEFLKPGTMKLYVPLEGSKSRTPASGNAAALFLNNDGKVISGLFRADFQELKVVCQAVTSASSKVSIEPKSVLACARQTGLIKANELDSCFAIIDEGDNEALVEIHSKVCGGDPQTSPARAFFSQAAAGLGYEAGRHGWVACPAR
jgi:hypothetical protein